MLIRASAAGVGLAGLPAFLAACGSDDAKSGGDGTATKFSMQAAWVNDAEFMGYFVALTNGYYLDEGLDLTYLSGGPDVIPESTLLSGGAPLALTTPDSTINAIVNDGAPFVIIGAQYQKNPIGVISLKKNPINSPAPKEPHRCHQLEEEPDQFPSRFSGQDLGRASVEHPLRRGHAQVERHR